MAVTQQTEQAGTMQLVLLFVLGFGLFIFTRRSELVPTIPAMIVVAPVFILRFSRILPVRRAMALTLLGFIVSMNVALWGLFDYADAGTELVFNVLRASLLAALYAMPYLIDRLLYARNGASGWSILAFPAAVTAVMFVASLEGPFDGTAAKTIFALGTPELMQLYALTGLWGFVFLWSVPAALVNHVWARGFTVRNAALAASMFAVLAGGVYAYGANRLSSATETASVRIASAVLLPEDGQAVSMERYFAEQKVLPYAETLRRIEDLAAKAAARGARIISFQEHALTIMEAEIGRVRADYSRIAAENGVWLSITYSWYKQEGKGANVHLLIDDQGEIRADYDKRYLLGFGPWGETGVFQKGATVIQTADTPYGRLAISTCRDMSFPAFARQAGQAGADIMLVPSYDFPKSTSPSDGGRAIENGFAIVRPTYNGMSYAMDGYGRLLAMVDSDDGGSGLMFADVPMKGTRTPYARFGEWFGWSGVMLLMFLIAIAVMRPALSRAVWWRRGE